MKTLAGSAVLARREAGDSPGLTSLHGRRATLLAEREWKASFRNGLLDRSTERSHRRTGMLVRVAFVLALVPYVALMPISTWAKQEAREQFWTWRIYGGTGHDFLTPEAPIEARNALQEQQYQQCIVGNCGTCGKVIYTPPTQVAAPTAKINGKLTFLNTAGGTLTQYKPACTTSSGTTPPVGPVSTPTGGDLGVIAVRRCPADYGMANSALQHETIGGFQVPTYRSLCVKDVPDPPTCCKLDDIVPTDFGNPVNALVGAKVAREIDYRAADGLLSVERSYSSQFGHWSWDHDAAIADFTGRTAASPPSSMLIANTQEWPAALTTPTPPLSDIARPFPLVRTLANENVPQVWIIGRNGNRTVFTEGPTNTFTTLAAQKRQLSAITGPGGAPRWLLRIPSGVFEIYDATGRLIERIAADGKSLTYQRTANTLTVTESTGGRQLVYSRSDPNLVEGAYDVVTLPDGNQIQYTFDAYSMVTSVTYADTRTKTYLYDEPSYSSNSGAKLNLLTGLNDENSVRHATYAYGGKLPISTELAGGVNKHTFASFTTFRNVTTPPLDAQVTVRWDTGPDGERRLTSRTQPAGAGSTASTSSVAYDAAGNIASWTDYKGSKTCYANDSTRNVETARLEGLATGAACPVNIVSHTIPSNTVQRKISTQWHPTWNLPAKRAGPKLITSWIYNGQPDPFAGGTASCAAGAPVLPDGSAIAVICKKVEQETSDATGSSGFTAATTGTPRVWNYTYNAHGQLLTSDGPRADVADVTTYTYYDCSTGYQCGQLAALTNPAGHVTTYNSYNAHAQPLSITDANGTVTTLTYDLRQRLTSRTVGGEQTTFDYWPTGLLKRAILADGSYVEYTYDAAHRLSAINDGEGNRITYALDSAGNRTAEQTYDPYNVLATTRTRTFDALSRLASEIGAAGTGALTTSYGYDNNGNQTTTNAPLSRSTSQTYDELNRLKQVTDPASGVTKFSYDGLDQLLSVTDPRNKVTSYTSSGLGQLTQQVSPDTGTATSTYDSAGNLQTSTDARGKTATYTNDELNRLTSLTYADQTIGYTYDSGSNQKGRLTQVTDASGSTSWSYDAQGRVLTRQQSMGIVKTLSYAYDTAGRLQTLTLPSGNTVTYGYTNGKVTSLTLNGSTTILSNVLYQPFGPTRGWTWGNSTLAIREYDTDGKITDIDSAGLKTYSYDDAFRLTGITDTTDSALSQSYGYDLLDRLTSATGTNLNQGWTYDANGNRLTQTGSQASTFTVSTTNNRLSGVSGSLTRAYSYDNSGNTTTDGATTFTYNDAGRMVSVTKAGVTTSYAINALGQRVKKTTSAVSTYFGYDEPGRLVGEYDSSGNLIQETIWFDDTPVAVLKPNGGNGVNVFHIHSDHLNTPRQISRPSDNAVVWKWDSDPFGTSAANQDPDGDSSQFAYNLRFPGQYADAETGLHYNYFRDYDPQGGRYVESDPIGLAGGLNTYAYANNNPVSFTDPLGLDAVPAPGDSSDHSSGVRARHSGVQRPGRFRFAVSRRLDAADHGDFARKRCGHTDQGRLREICEC